MAQKGQTPGNSNNDAISQLFHLAITEVEAEEKGELIANRTPQQQRGYDLIDAIRIMPPNKDGAGQELLKTVHALLTHPEGIDLSVVDRDGKTALAWANQKSFSVSAALIAKASEKVEPLTPSFVALALAESAPRRNPKQQKAIDLIDAIRAMPPRGENAGVELVKQVQKFLEDPYEIDLSHADRSGLTALDWAMKKSFTVSAFLIAKAIADAPNLTKNQKQKLVPFSADDIEDDSLFVQLNSIRTDIIDQLPPGLPRGAHAHEIEKEQKLRGYSDSPPPSNLKVQADTPDPGSFQYPSTPPHRGYPGDLPPSGPPTPRGPHWK